MQSHHKDTSIKTTSGLRGMPAAPPTALQTLLERCEFLIAASMAASMAAPNTAHSPV